jgi:hypothetical protein
MESLTALHPRVNANRQHKPLPPLKPSAAASAV